MKDFQIIVLAGGAGRRMGRHEVPKVLLPLSGKPLINHTLAAVSQSGLDPRPAIVVGRQGESIAAALGQNFQYIFQLDADGPGRAVLAAKKVLQHSSRHVLVLPGDHPFVGAGFLRRFAEAHLAGGSAVTLATASVAEYEAQDAFADYDRVARDSFGQVSRLLSPSLTRGSEAVWPEVSPGYFCFQASWLWPNLYRLGDANPEHESRLADLVNIALAERKTVGEARVVPIEALGADTPEQLKFLENQQSQF